MIKKVQAKQIVVTPNATSHVNLAEMNEILRKMSLGKQAIREMAELDSNRGMTGKVKQRDDFGREVGAGSNLGRGSNVAGSDAALAIDDAGLAADLQTQAQRMAAEARGLLAESDRLMRESAQLSGTATVTEKATRGRPKKAKSTNAA
jgi:hypothetical protein